MTQYIVSISVLIVFLIAQNVLHYYETKRQQETIDKLAEQLMARNYTEYKTMNEPAPVEEPRRKPMSFYDDPDIPEDEE